MSSIFQQEVRKPSPKSPIPRSRSDFNYVGLQSKDKRWTTDFSSLLPAFSRDSTGYSRLTETPVTLQPRTKSSAIKLTKSSTADSSILCMHSNSNQTDKTLNSDSGNNSNQATQPKSRIHNPFNTDICDSQRRDSFPQPAVFSKTKQSLITLDQPCRHHPKQEQNIRRSPTVDPKILQSSSPYNTPNVISRSPTLDPAILTRSPKEANRWPPTSDAKGIVVNRSPLCGCGPSSEVVRSQSLRSLKRPLDKSPSRIRNSESAQSDVTGSTLKPSTVVEADELEDEDDLRRLRHFSVTPKGLINWGDSFRSHSLTSVHPTSSNDGSQWDIASTRSYPLATSNSQWSCNKAPFRYKVAIMGLEEVGKTSLIRQFQTSEYICAFDTSYDVSNEYVITVILNEEESELEFLEYRCADEEEQKPEKESDIPIADAHVIVYSVTNRRSFLRALDLLALVQKTFRRSAVLLVGNKSDLVRVRAVTTDEGQTAAKEKGTSFIETSAAINHQVDELLVSILSQIRTKTKSSSSSGRWSGPNGSSSLSKAKGLIKKFLKKACFQSKSCDNLQRL